MEILQAVNTVLPHLGEHVITTIEGARHPTVDLITAAIDRHRLMLLAEGLWFNETTLTLPVNTDGFIATPTGTISIYGEDCNVELDGTRLLNLDSGSNYFDTAICVTIVRDVQFSKLPINLALCVTYRAGAEVYLQDYGRENTVPELQLLANTTWVKVAQEDLRKRKYNSQKRTRARINGAVRFR